MYIVFAEELGGAADPTGHRVDTLEQAFAQIACRCGYSYAFEQEADGWKMVSTDVERPECSPEPIISTCLRPRDARYDLLSQAVDGRLKGYLALSSDDFARARLR